MEPAEASPAALELYEAIDPALTESDAEYGYAALGLCVGLVSGNIDLIHELVSYMDGRPGWQILLDPARCPAVFLPFLAQFVGARLTPSMTEADQRAAIAEPEAFGRGTLPAMVSVAKRRLAGNKTVLVVERYTGLAYRMKVVTIESETPEPDETLREITEQQKPMGVRLFFNSSPDWTWAELEEEEATWTATVATFATWGAVLTNSP